MMSLVPCTRSQAPLEIFELDYPVSGFQPRTEAGPEGNLEAGTHTSRQIGKAERARRPSKPGVANGAVGEAVGADGLVERHVATHRHTGHWMAAQREQLENHDRECKGVVLRGSNDPPRDRAPAAPER